MDCLRKSSKLEEVVPIIRTNDRISLIFLLCPDTNEAIDLCETLSDLKFQQLLQKQQQQLPEALGIIQHYKAAHMLGFKKENILQDFIPDNKSVSLDVDRVKKILYKFCESLTTEETKRFIDNFEKDNKIDVEGDELKKLEVKLLCWCKNGLINIQRNNAPINLDKLMKYFKVFNLESFKLDLKSAIKQSNSQPIEASNIISLERNKQVSISLGQKTPDVSDIYPIIDPDNVGYCVIINEKHFHRSSDQKYQHLLPSQNFETRLGTDTDVQHLTETFTMLGFEVACHNDLTYKAFTNILDHYSTHIPDHHSCFILIILSHGSENVVYTSDSVPVNVDDIEMTFQGHNCPALLNKPKIFIIQSCQGTEWQQVQVDGTKPAGGERADAMIAWSTVKGYASFRDIHKGAWFIEELCKQIWADDCTDFVKVLQKVNNSLRSKVYSGQFMVPWLSLTLCKTICFPKRKDKRVLGTKLMIERILFDKYLKEMLKSLFVEEKLEGFHQQM